MVIVRTLILVCLMVLPSAAEDNVDLFEALASAPNEAIGRAVENRIWQLWMKGPNETATELMSKAMERRRWYDFAGALEELDKAVIIAPNWATLWNQRAFILFLQGHHDKSLDNLDRAIELEPLHFAALTGKARILMAQGRIALGQKALRRAVKIHPWLKERSLLIKLPKVKPIGVPL